MTVPLPLDLMVIQNKNVLEIIQILSLFSTISIKFVVLSSWKCYEQGSSMNTTSQQKISCLKQTNGIYNLIIFKMFRILFMNHTNNQDNYNLSENRNR